MVASRKTVTLSPEQAGQIADLRDALMHRTREALETLQPSLQGDAERAIDRIVKSGYKEAVIKREVRKLSRGHFKRLRAELASGIEDTAMLVARYQAYMEAFAMEGTAAQFVAPSRVAHAMAYGEGQTQAALSGQIADLKRHKFVPKTEGDRIIARELRPWREVRKLSTRLHSAQINAERESIRLSMRAVREGKALQANNDLILGLARKGHTVGGAESLPKYLQDFQKAGNRLMEMQKPSPRDKAATKEYNKRLREWRSQRDQVARYARRLNDGGRVQNALTDVLQRTSADNAKRMKTALRGFLGQKQSYHAERILDTELHAAFRSAQVESDMRQPLIVGYIWRMQRGARADFKKRTKPRKIKLRSGRRSSRARRCICEMMAGRRLSKEALQMYPQGGHPHCMCFFEPIWDRRGIATRRASAAEEDWYAREFGD